MPALREELEPLVAEIRRNAHDRYGREWETVMRLNDDGTRVLHDRPRVEGAQAGLQSLLDGFNALLSSLEREFATYYELETVDLIQISANLGGRRAAPNLDDPAGSLATGDVNSVCERLHFADAHWVARLAPEPPTPLTPASSASDQRAARYRQWGGAAATAFNDQFLWPFRAAQERQSVYVKLLTVAVESFREGVERMSHDVLAIARACVRALRSDIEGRDPDLGGFLTVAGIVATAVALVPGVGEVEVALLGAASLTTGVASLLTDSQDHAARRPEFAVEGLEAQDILYSTFDQLAKMKSHAAEEDARLAGVLSQLATASPGDLERPAVADDPRAFGTVDSTDANVVTAEVEDLYRAGYTWLPAAAAEYDKAQELLYRYGTPRSCDIAMPFSVRPYHDARSNLSVTLARIRDSLTGAGAALVQVADNYFDADAVAQSRFRVFTQSVPPPPPASEPYTRRSGLPF